MEFMAYKTGGEYLTSWETVMLLQINSASWNLLYEGFNAWLSEI